MARRNCPTTCLDLHARLHAGSRRIFLSILRPINCETVSHQPFAKINIVNGACRHRAPILIQRDRAAAHGPSGNEGVEIVRSLRSAAILQAVFSPAKLAALWSVDAPQPYSRPVNFQGVTSPRVKRISGSRTFCSSPQKDFCNNIGDKADLVVTSADFRK